MKNRKYVFAAALGMLLLILDSRCALESARQGLELCILTVIPSLFPFLFLSSILTAGLWGSRSRLLRLAANCFRIPAGAESLLLSGFLGGYPAGAAAIGEAYQKGRLQPDTARRLLACCSNAGPAFLFGMVAPQFPDKAMVFLLWGIHMVSAALVSFCFPCPKEPQTVLDAKKLSVTQTMHRSLRTMALICGWILLFRIIIGFLDRWVLWMLPDPVRILIWGFLELSNGCCALGRIQSVSLRFVAAAAMISFGGLCVAMQTASVTYGLPVKAYWKGKVLQTLFSILLSAAAIHGLWVLAAIILTAVLILPKDVKKEVAIRRLS